MTSSFRSDDASGQLSARFLLTSALSVAAGTGALIALVAAGSMLFDATPSQSVITQRIEAAAARSTDEPGRVAPPAQRRAKPLTGTKQAASVPTAASAGAGSRRPASARPATTRPTQHAKPAQPRAAQPKPAQPKPKPAQSKPTQPKPAQSKPTKPEPAQSKPTQPASQPASQPVSQPASQPDPAPAAAKPAETKPAAPKPAPSTGGSKGGTGSVLLDLIGKILRGLTGT